MSIDERPFFDVSPDGTTIINDRRSKEYYEAGFRLAVNFLYAIIPQENDLEINKAKFKEHVNSALQTIQIEDDFFKDNPILPANENYPVGLCPGPGGTCIDCPDASFGS